MPDTESRIRDIQNRLRAIAPLPQSGEVSPLAVARHLAVNALHRSIVLLDPAVDLDPRNIAAMCSEFAAATALYALAATAHGQGSAELELGIGPAVPEVLRDMKPGEVGAFIRDCWEDGGSIGEFLWEYLGEDTCRQVKELVDELVAANAAEAVSQDA